MTVYDLPVVNAALNGTCAVLLVIARKQIRQGHIATHRKLMIAAFTLSILFLACYLIYHAYAGHVPFMGEGWSRPLYFTILTSHTLLAVSVPVLATMTLVRGLKSRYNKHRAIAKWTYPIWLYVSATGVIVYLMLYQLFPSHA